MRAAMPQSCSALVDPAEAGSPEADLWVTAFGEVDPENPIEFVYDLLDDGIDPTTARGRRLLLEIEFPELGWGEEIDVDEHGLAVTANGYRVPAATHPSMLELVAGQLFDRDLVGLGAATDQLASLGLYRNELLHELALVIGRHVDHAGCGGVTDMSALRRSLDALPTAVVYGEDDFGDFGIRLLERAVRAGNDERVRRILDIRLRSDCDEWAEELLMGDLSRMYERVGRLDQALVAARRSHLCAGLDDDDSAYRELRVALLLLKLGDSEQAEAKLLSIRARHGDDLEVYVAAAEVYESIGNTEAATLWATDGIRVATGKKRLIWSEQWEARRLLNLRSQQMDGPPDAECTAVEALIEDTHRMFAEPTKWQPRTVPTTPGRNDPCPCNSGQKYKRCCLA